MPITLEALERKEIGEPARRIPYENGVYLHNYESWFRDQGRAILDEAQVPAVLVEMVEAIKPKYPDARIDSDLVIVLTHGVVSMGMSWNFREEPVGLGVVGRYYDRIQVMARLAKRELGITTSKGLQVLQETEWNSREILEDAMIVAFQHPLRWEDNGVPKV